MGAPDPEAARRAAMEESVIGMAWGAKRRKAQFSKVLPRACLGLLLCAGHLLRLQKSRRDEFCLRAR